MLIFKKGRQKGIVLKGKRAFFAKGVQAYFALDISIGGGVAGLEFSSSWEG